MPGDTLTILDLLYAMMLPSGNDAAYALAEFFGGHLRQAYQYGKYNRLMQIHNSRARRRLQRSYNCFIFYMNKQAKALQMTKTHFANPHGLINKLNKSTVQDLAKLCQVVLDNPVCSRVVRTKTYRTIITNTRQDQKGGARKPTSRAWSWKNTNKLLDKEGYTGLKTGWTFTA